MYSFFLKITKLIINKITASFIAKKNNSQHCIGIQQNRVKS